MSDTENTQQDYYSMSDEELLNYTPEQTENTSTETEQPKDTQVQETSQDVENVNVDGNTETTETNEQTDTLEVGTEESVTTTEDVDYKAFFEKVTGTFKANGKEIRVENPDDIISLMQQGANYSKRMQELKPKANLVKTLEQHGLTDPEKLAFAIDLVNKKPEAIAKLVKDAELDLYSFDTEQADNYQPQNPIVESSVFEEVLQQLQTSSPNYNQLVNTISAWDNQSKQFIFENPELLNILDGEISNGMFDKVVNIIEYEQMMGRMLNQPFLHSYREIEARLNSQANTSQPQAQQQSFVDTRPNNTPSSNNVEQKMKTATPSNTHTGDVAQPDINSMSDAELLAYMEKHTKR